MGDAAGSGASETVEQGGFGRLKLGTGAGGTSTGTGNFSGRAATRSSDGGDALVGGSGAGVPFPMSPSEPLPVGICGG